MEAKDSKAHTSNENLIAENANKDEFVPSQRDWDSLGCLRNQLLPSQCHLECIPSKEFKS